ncbi:hypothetical protein LGV61_02415 [Desulfurispirillum indicum]|uniref:Uncharacterized protein n=1 Tax=Desulfurispirillum indicum (strain ATCC BAA-1389 / DSM 22839 / S5) TaxID=653733 RepID=E6W0K0_DESIS|nr:hypothetical protein [Desulfurispirillum indicum]ADU65252.1 hypothetical protein Selin_0501 [Desulfurispirillum indicum S5]UCZ57150.1 hypothetical protein LGV61_02415 [Desulfurispirillum indicum]
MHSGCSGTFTSGAQVVDKLRMMGFNNQFFPIPVHFTCTNCQTEFMMETLESQCPSCHMTYGVTPCHAHDPDSIQAAGIHY